MREVTLGADCTIRAMPTAVTPTRRAFDWLLRGTLALGSVGVLAGCDPILDVAGAFFPAWLLAAIGGVFVTLLVRWILALTKIEPELLWPTLAYLGVFVMSSISLWLVFFAT